MKVLEMMVKWVLRVDVDAGLGGDGVACLKKGADVAVMDPTVSVMFLQTIWHPL